MKSFFIFISSLFLSISVFASKKPTAKPAPSFLNYEIFGEKNACTPVLDFQLKNHVYYIVSGHNKWCAYFRR
jgi:N-acetylmuramoyl-L-alanine amidase